MIESTRVCNKACAELSEIVRVVAVTKMLALRGRLSPESRVGILGLTFKENVSDLRNSRVPDIVEELRGFGVEPLVHDPMVDREEALHELKVTVRDLKELSDLDALIFAVLHRELLSIPVDRLRGMVRDGGAVVDVKSALDPKKLRPGLEYWSL